MGHHSSVTLQLLIPRLPGQREYSSFLWQDLDLPRGLLLVLNSQRRSSQKPSYSEAQTTTADSEEQQLYFELTLPRRWCSLF